MAVERTTEERDLTDLSVSRITTANRCGLAFEHKYVRKLPTPTGSASAIFGSVIHEGVEEWFGGPGPITNDNRDTHKNWELDEIVRQKWPDKLPPTIWDLVQELLLLDIERSAVCAAILMKRPTLKAPMQTKEFLESKAAKEFNEKHLELINICNEFEEIRWSKDENAFQAFQKSLQIAERIQKEWREQPRPFLIEEPFRLEFEGFVLRGAIDSVPQLIDPKTGQLQRRLVRDIKTGKSLMTQMEVFLQAFIYNEAVRQMDYDFLDEDIVDFDFFMARHVNPNGRTKRQAGRIDRERHERLALRILNGVARRIISASFEPHYGFHCKTCDFKDLCEAELSLWSGPDGVGVE